MSVGLRMKSSVIFFILSTMFLFGCTRKEDYEAYKKREELEKQDSIFRNQIKRENKGFFSKECINNICTCSDGNKLITCEFYDSLRS